MENITQSVSDLILKELILWNKTERDVKKRMTELLALGEKLIAFFGQHYQGPLTPTPHNVVSICLEEMANWSALKADVTGLSERLIRYFHVFSLQPSQLDGLPGNPLDQVINHTLGRRPKPTKAGLLNGSTGLILPNA